MMSKDIPSTDVTSPCVGICTLDSVSVCIGCGRSIGEIAEWSRATEARRRIIVDTARRRLAALSTSMGTTPTASGPLASG